jgi:hypothetical protein
LPYRTDILGAASNVAFGQKQKSAAALAASRSGDLYLHQD